MAETPKMRAEPWTALASPGHASAWRCRMDALDVVVEVMVDLPAAADVVEEIATVIVTAEAVEMIGA